MFDINELYSNRIKGKINNPNKTKKENILDVTKACAAYLKVEHNLNLDSKSEITPSRGIKEVINFLSIGFVNKDDYIITISPSYNKISSVVEWLEGKTYEYKLHRFNKYLIDFEDIEENILKKCKILHINYPNNPTGEVANKEFFKDIIKYAKKYNFIVINDASDIDLCFNDIDKISFMSVEGAKDIGVELYKVNNQNFIVGNKNIIKIYEMINENVGFDYNIEPKLFDNQDIYNKQRNQLYLKRHETMKKILEKNGFKCAIPKAGYNVYVSIPKRCNGVSFESANEFSIWLMENIQINVTSYDVEGKYISFSLNFVDNEEMERKIFEELEDRLSKFKFEF